MWKPTKTKMREDFVCRDCKKLIDLSYTRVPGYCGGTGYAYFPETEAKICYPCCAKREEKWMQEHGKATLYIVRHGMPITWKVTDWAGHLEFNVTRHKFGRHNIGQLRLDVWFIDSHGHEWHGINIGDNNLLRCKRLKRQPK
jgi:hypothetical protein